MLKLVLSLPQRTVAYNSVGVRMSGEDVTGLPAKIKAIKKDVMVVGYSTPDGFLANDIVIDGVTAVGDKLNMLTMLGIKSVPFVQTPSVIGEEDRLIKVLEMYAIYNPKWVDVTTGKEFKLPEVTMVEAVNWGLDAKSRLTMQLKTKLGEFSVIDHRTPAGYQVGCLVKIMNGEPKPMMTRPIMSAIPSHCPNCNNPLFRLQLDNTLPLIYKCKAPMCKKFNTKPEDLKRDIEEGLVDIAEVTAVKVEEAVEVSEETAGIVDETPNIEDKMLVKSYKVICEFELKPELAEKVEVVGDTEPADYILTKMKGNPTKKAKELSKDTSIPLISVQELEEMLNG